MQAAYYNEHAHNAEQLHYKCLLLERINGRYTQAVPSLTMYNSKRFNIPIERSTEYLSRLPSSSLCAAFTCIHIEKVTEL